MSQTVNTHIQFKVLSGASKGDMISLEIGTCRLVGRHLGENETLVLTQDGTRPLEQQEIQLFEQQLEKAGKPHARKMTSFKRGADIILSDETVSRAHAMLFVDSSGAGVVDLASTNGTSVNEHLQNAGLLQKGDKIKFGETILERVV